VRVSRPRTPAADSAPESRAHLGHLARLRAEPSSREMARRILRPTGSAPAPEAPATESAARHRHNASADDDLSDMLRTLRGEDNRYGYDQGRGVSALQKFLGGNAQARDAPSVSAISSILSADSEDQSPRVSKAWSQGSDLDDAEIVEVVSPFDGLAPTEVSSAASSPQGMELFEEDSEDDDTYGSLDGDSDNDDDDDDDGGLEASMINRYLGLMGGPPKEASTRKAVARRADNARKPTEHKLQPTEAEPERKSPPPVESLPVPKRSSPPTAANNPRTGKRKILQPKGEAQADVVHKTSPNQGERDAQFEELKESLFKKKTTENVAPEEQPPGMRRKSILKPTGKARNRQHIVPTTEEKGSEDAEDASDSASTKESASSGDSSEDSAAKKAEEESVMKERRAAQAQQFAALRVQRHIQERIYILRQRRRMQMGLLDSLSENAGHETDEEDAEEDDMGGSRDNVLYTTPVKGSRSSSSRVSPTELGQLVMSGWMLKRQRKIFRVGRGEQKRLRQADRWNWRHFHINGMTLEWRKVDFSGRTKWPNVKMLPSPSTSVPLPRRPSPQRFSFTTRSNSSSSVGVGAESDDEVVDLASPASEAAQKESGDRKSFFSRFKRSKSGRSSPEPPVDELREVGRECNCPPPDVLRLIMNEEEARIFSAREREMSPRGAVDDDSGSDWKEVGVSDAFTQEGDAGCSPGIRHVRSRSSLSRPSQLDLSGLVIVLPDGKYPTLDPSLKWPKYHIQLFEEPERWYDGWTEDYGYVAPASSWMVVVTIGIKRVPVSMEGTPGETTDRSLLRRFAGQFSSCGRRATRST